MKKKDKQKATWALISAGSAAVVGMTQRAALRGAALGWKRKTGALPPRG